MGTTDIIIKVTGDNHTGTTVEATLSVTPVTLTVTPNADVITYGDAAPVLTFGITGFVNGETVTTAGIAGTAATSTIYDATDATNRNAGSYAITVDDVTTMTSEKGNYVFVAGTPATLTVNKKPIEITLGFHTKNVGEVDPSFGAAFSGVINGDTLNYAVTRIVGEAEGSYRIFGEQRDNMNYTISFVDGGLTILDTVEEILVPGTPDTTPTPVPATPGTTPTPEITGEPVGEVEIEDGETALGDGEVEIEDGETPLGDGEVEIEDTVTPLGAVGSWALINLLLAIGTTLGSFILVVNYFRKKKCEDEESLEEEKLKRTKARLTSILVAIAAIVTFILTEDMTLPMVMVDKWTLLMVVIAVLQAAVGYVSKRNDENKELVTE